jgi:hypothetical protein
VAAVRSFPIDEQLSNRDLGSVCANANLTSAAAFLEEAAVDWVLGSGNADAVAAVKQGIEASRLEPGLKRALLAALEAGR